MPTGGQEHAFALVVGDDGDPDLLQDGWQDPAFRQSTPARDCGIPAHEFDVFRWQADRADVRLEVQRFLQLNECQVVLVGEEVVVRVHDFLLRGSFHEGIWFHG